MKFCVLSNARHPQLTPCEGVSSTVLAPQLLDLHFHVAHWESGTFGEAELDEPACEGLGMHTASAVGLTMPNQPLQSKAGTPCASTAPSLQKTRHPPPKSWCASHSFNICSLKRAGDMPRIRSFLDRPAANVRITGRGTSRNLVTE